MAVGSMPDSQEFRDRVPRWKQISFSIILVHGPNLGLAFWSNLNLPFDNPVLLSTSLNLPRTLLARYSFNYIS